MIEVDYIEQGDCVKLMRKLPERSIDISNI